MQVNDSIDSALGDLGRPPSPMKGVVGGVSSKVAAVAVVLVLALVATAVAAVAASCSCSSFPRAPRERATLPMRYQGTSAMSRAVSRPMNCAMNLRRVFFQMQESVESLPELPDHDFDNLDDDFDGLDTEFL